MNGVSGSPPEAPPQPTATASLAAVAEAVFGTAGDTTDSQPTRDSQPVGFVHVGRDDADSRYLTRAAHTDSETAVVILPAAATEADRTVATYCLSATDHPGSAAAFETELSEIELSETELKRRVDRRPPATATGSQVVSALADQLSTPGAGILFVPRYLPHDAAVLLEQAGYELRSTPALTTARSRKTRIERDRLRAVQQATAQGMDRAMSVLAGCDIGPGQVISDEQPLSDRQLGAEIRLELAQAGVVAETIRVQPTGNSQSRTQSSPTPLPVGVPLVLDIRARGPAGYCGRRTQTVVVDSDGGWDRRAYIAAQAGINAALSHCAPGESVHTVRREAVAETAAYGFSPAGMDETTSQSPKTTGSAAPPDEPVGASAVVHGIGLSRHEAPSADDDGKLREGSTLAIETSVVEPAYGAIRLCRLLEVTEDGGKWLTDREYSLTPSSP